MNTTLSKKEKSLKKKNPNNKNIKESEWLGLRIIKSGANITMKND